MKKILAIILIVVIIGVFVFQLIKFQITAPHKKIIESGKSRVRVIKLVRRNMQKVLSYTGDIKGIREVLVYPDIAGILKEKLKTSGERVKKDETILMIDRYEEALQYSMYSVKSPIGGMVLEIFQDVGSRVLPSKPLARVGDLSSVEIKVEIPHDEAAMVSVWQPVKVKVDTLPREVFSGRIKEIGAAFDRLNRKIPVKIIVSNSRGMLKSGMVCNAGIIVKIIKSAKVVPVLAVTERDGNKGLFIVDDKNVAHWVEVKILIQGEKFVAVRGNVNEKDRVVVEGNYGLVPDRVVEILK